MTRRLGLRRGFAALASLSLATTLAGAGATGAVKLTLMSPIVVDAGHDVAPGLAAHQPPLLVANTEVS